MVLRYPRRDRGSLVAAVVLSLAGIALLGLLAHRTFDQMLRGGASIGLSAEARAVVMQSALTLSVESSDTDDDGYLESPASQAGATIPVGGGEIPASSAARRADPWGRALGYCAWDNGRVGKTTSVGRIAGDDDASSASRVSPNSVVFAVLSAGPDRRFDTTCAAARTGANGDDIAERYTLARIARGTTGSPFFGAPVSTVAAATLDPGVLRHGEVRLQKDTNTIAHWDGGQRKWVSLGGATGGASSTATFKNLLTNGGFEIWQRGTAKNCGTAACYAADRWLINGVATTSGAQALGMGATFATFGSYSFSASTASEGNGPDAGSKVLNIYRGSVSGNPPADMEILTQRIESAMTLSGQTITASFWIKTSGDTKRFCSDVYQFFGKNAAPSGRSNGRRCYDATPTWTKQSITVALANVDPTSLKADHAVWFRPIMEPQSTTGGRTASFGVSIAEVQLEAGSGASPFEKRPLAFDLAVVQRYYETGTVRSNRHPFVVETGSNTLLTLTQIYYKVPKRISVRPTFVSRVGVNQNCATPTTQASYFDTKYFQAYRYALNLACTFDDKWEADAEFFD